MKKRYGAIIVFLAIAFLAGCSKKTEYSVDQIGLNISLADEWMKQVTYSTDTINEYVETEDHYRVYIPQDISSSLRVNVLNVEEQMTTRFVNLYVPYATGTSFTTAAQSTLVSIYTSYFEDENALSMDFSASIPSVWTSPVDIKDDMKDTESGKVRTLYSVYMPTYVEHYGSYSGEIKVDCKTYVLVPIAFGVERSTTDDLLANLENVGASIKTMSTVIFYSKDGVLVNPE